MWIDFCKKREIANFYSFILAPENFTRGRVSKKKGRSKVVSQKKEAVCKESNSILVMVRTVNGAENSSRK